ncbi:MAG: hypothetical protein QM688_15265 [Sphingomonas bacterium]
MSHLITITAAGAHGDGTLARPNGTLTALARELAGCARALLPDGAGLFMGVERDAHGAVRLIWWRASDLRLIAEISAAPDAFCPPDSAEGMLQDAAGPLLAYLAGRWPMPPAALGVITDGEGVAFVPDHPALSAPRWLDRLAMGAMTLTTIIPFDALGPCGLLSPGLAAPSLLH